MYTIQQKTSDTQLQMLQVKQGTLGLKPAGIASEATLRSDDSVAGYDDRDRVARVGQPDCPRRSGLADLAGDLTIGTGLSVGDLAQRVPHPLLEIGATWSDSDIETSAFTSEVFLNLGDNIGERSLILDPAVALRRWMGRSFHHQIGEAVTLAGQGEQADGAVDAPIEGKAGQGHGGSSA